jgi:hypothetical protein
VHFRQNANCSSVVIAFFKLVEGAIYLFLLEKQIQGTLEKAFLSLDKVKRE